MTHPTGPPDVVKVKDALWHIPAQLTSYVVATSNGPQRISDIARDALAVIKALEKDSKESLDLYRNNRTRLEARIAALEEAARRVLDEMDICLETTTPGCDDPLCGCHTKIHYPKMATVGSEETPAPRKDCMAAGSKTVDAPVATSSIGSRPHERDFGKSCQCGAEDCPGNSKCVEMRECRCCGKRIEGDPWAGRFCSARCRDNYASFARQHSDEASAPATPVEAILEDRARGEGGGRIMVPGTVPLARPASPSPLQGGDAK